MFERVCFLCLAYSSTFSLKFENILRYLFKNIKTDFIFSHKIADAIGMSIKYNYDLNKSTRISFKEVRISFNLKNCTVELNLEMDHSMAKHKMV